MNTRRTGNRQYRDDSQGGQSGRGQRVHAGVTRALLHRVIGDTDGQDHVRGQGVFDFLGQILEGLMLAHGDGGVAVQVVEAVRVVGQHGDLVPAEALPVQFVDGVERFVLQLVHGNVDQLVHSFSSFSPWACRLR